MIDVIQLPTPAHISPAWLAQPRHSRERRHFSVLCWRGWCDHEFKVRAVAALSAEFNGPGALPDLPHRECPIPAECQCECHDQPAGSA